jgi:hypothetical protein
MRATFPVRQVAERWDEDTHHTPGQRTCQTGKVGWAGRPDDCQIGLTTYKHAAMLSLPMPRKLTAYYIDPELMEALRRYRDDTGMPMGEAVRRAIRAWLEARRYLKAARKRAGTRKRA